MTIKEKVVEIVEAKGEVSLDELKNEIETHPLVLNKVLKELEKEKKIKINKKVQHHKSKKFVKIISLA